MNVIVVKKNGIGGGCSFETTRECNTLKEAKQAFEKLKIDTRKEASPIFWKNGVHVTQIVELDENEESFDILEEYVEDKDGKYKGCKI